MNEKTEMTVQSTEDITVAPVEKKRLPNSDLDVETDGNQQSSQETSYEHPAKRIKVDEYGTNGHDSYAHSSNAMSIDSINNISEHVNRLDSSAPNSQPGSGNSETVDIPVVEMSDSNENLVQLAESTSRPKSPVKGNVSMPVRPSSPGKGTGFASARPPSPARDLVRPASPVKETVPGSSQSKSPARERSASPSKSPGKERSVSPSRPKSPFKESSQDYIPDSLPKSDSPKKTVAPPPVQHFDSQMSISSETDRETPRPTPILTSAEPHQLSMTDDERAQALHALQMKWCANTLRNLKRQNDAGPFLKPVDPVLLGIPDYFNIIKHPMDLSTIESKLHSKQYENSSDFIADIELMLQNCFTFNPPNHAVHVMGKNLEKVFKNNYLAKLPKEGDELKPQSHKMSAPSPVINRPSRDIHPPKEFVIDEPIKKKAKRRSDDLRWCAKVHQELLKKQYETFMFAFYQPVDPIALNIPQYLDIIKNPMDLGTMKKKLDAGEYKTAAEYEADFRLMVENCFTFNRPGDAVYIMGQKAEEVFNRKWGDKPAFNASTPRESLGGTSRPPKSSKSRPSLGISDFDASSDDEDSDKLQIQMVEQQIQLLHKQLETLKRKRERKLEKRKSGGGSRRSSKGSSHVDLSQTISHAPPQSAEAAPSAPKAAASPAPAPAPRQPKPPKPPKEPKQKGKVGRPRKPIDPPEIREITFEEKRELSEAIPLLSVDKLNRVVQIIHESMPHLKDNANDEIELDIDSLDLITLNRLWYFVKGGKKKRPKVEDPNLNATHLSELEKELARMQGRTDLQKRFEGIGDETSSDSSSSGDSEDSD